jgi:hypothetical protein
LKSPDSVKFGDYTRSHPAPRVINTDKHAGYLHLRSQGTETKPEDVARLSPLADKHFNVLGRYLFTVTDSILRGELRPLRVPEAPEELFWAVGA